MITTRPRRLIQTALLTAFFLIASVCGGEPLKVACYPDFVPYASTHADGSAEGVLIDIWYLWSEKTGIDIAFVPMSLPDGIEAVADGEVDAHCGHFYTEERAAKLSYSDALIRTESILFVKKPTLDKRIADLKTPVATVRGDYSVGFLAKHFPSVRLQIFPDYRSLLTAVDDKEVPAFIYDYPKRFPGFSAPPPPDGYRGVDTLYSERIRAAVRRGNFDLIERINDGLSKISDEEMWALASKWNFYTKDNTVLIAVTAIAGVSLLILLFTMLYIRKLRSRLKI